MASRINQFLYPYKSLYFQGYATIPMVIFRASATCACTSSILSAFAVARKNTDACALYMGAKLSVTNNRRFNSRNKQFHRSLSYLLFTARRKAEEEKLKKPFQPLYITCPDGQHVQYINDDCYQSKDEKGGVVVRQSYPVRPLGPAREKPASDENSRTVMTNGTVIKVSYSKLF